MDKDRGILIEWKNATEDLGEGMNSTAIATSASLNIRITATINSDGRAPGRRLLSCRVRLEIGRLPSWFEGLTDFGPQWIWLHVAT